MPVPGADATCIVLLLAGHCDDVHAHVPEAGRGHDGSAAPLAVRRATLRVRRSRTQQLTRNVAPRRRYGAQHPLVVVKRNGGTAAGTKKYVVVGHCCESGDLITPAPGEPETIAERELATAEIGDLCVVEGSGAYCAGMSTKNYNSFPEAAEVMRDAKGALHLIRARQSLEQITANERPLPASAAL